MADQTLSSYPCTRHGKRRCTACATIDAADRTTAAIEAQTRQAAEAEARTVAALEADRRHREAAERDRIAAAESAAERAERNEAWAESDRRAATRNAAEEKVQGYATAEAERLVRRDAYIDGRIAGHGPDDTYVESYYRGVYGLEFDAKHPVIRESMREQLARVHGIDPNDPDAGRVRVGDGFAPVEETVRPMFTEITDPDEIRAFDKRMAKKESKFDLVEKVGGILFVLAILGGIGYGIYHSNTGGSSIGSVFYALVVMVVGSIAAFVIGFAVDAFFHFRKK